MLTQILLVAAFILTLIAAVQPQPRPYLHLGWLGIALWILTILLMRWHL